MDFVRAGLSLALSGYFLWQAFGSNAAEGNRAIYYGIFGALLLVMGIWRLVIAFRKPKPVA